MSTELLKLMKMAEHNEIRISDENKPKILSDRIGLELNGRAPETVYELSLDNCKVNSFEGFPPTVNKIRIMSAHNMGLNSFNGLIEQTKLLMVDFSDNKLSDLALLIEKCQNIECLNLGGNLLTTIDALKPLQDLKSLSILDLRKNAVTETPNYREEVFKLVPHLEYLDGTDLNGDKLDKSIAEDEDEDMTDSDDSSSIADYLEDDSMDAMMKIKVKIISTKLKFKKTTIKPRRWRGGDKAEIQNGVGSKVEVKNDDVDKAETQQDGAGNVGAPTGSRSSEQRGTERKHDIDNAGPDTEP